MRYTLKKAKILRGKKNFDVVFERGRKAEGRYVRCLYLSHTPLSESPHPACVVGFAVSRTVKRAVDRNTVKRFLRESYRRNQAILQLMFERLPSPLTMVFLFTKRVVHSSELPTFNEIEIDMKKLLHGIAAIRHES